MTALIGIQCDGCKRRRVTTTFMQPAAGPQRTIAKRDGWHTTRGRITLQTGESWGYARDICPDCWKVGVR